MIDTTTRAVPHQETLFTELQDGEAVLLHLQTHAYYGLNDTGKRIWQLITEGLTLGEICDRLQDQFEVSDEDVQQYVIGFANELSEANLVDISS